MDLHDGLPARFWDDYIEVCHRHGVPDASVRWYLIRVERYLKAQSSPIEQHAPEHVSTYLTEAGRAAAFPAWKYRQLVHALQLLLSMWSRRLGARTSIGSTGCSRLVRWNPSIPLLPATTLRCKVQPLLWFNRLPALYMLPAKKH